MLGIAALAAFAGCQSAPNQDVEAARTALARADSVEADLYAPTTYMAAADSFAAAMAEIEEQNAASSLTRKYEGAERLLAAAMETAQEAATEAVHQKAEARAAADSVIALARQAVDAASEVMTRIRSESASTLIDGAVAARDQGDYLTARELAQKALDRLATPVPAPENPRS